MFLSCLLLLMRCSCLSLLLLLSYFGFWSFSHLWFRNQVPLISWAGNSLWRNVLKTHSSDAFTFLCARSFKVKSFFPSQSQWVLLHVTFEIHIISLHLIHWPLVKFLIWNCQKDYRISLYTDPTLAQLSRPKMSKVSPLACTTLHLDYSNQYFLLSFLSSYWWQKQ